MTYEVTVSDSSYSVTLSSNPNENASIDSDYSVTTSEAVYTSNVIDSSYTVVASDTNYSISLSNNITQVSTADSLYNVALSSTDMNVSVTSSAIEVSASGVGQQGVPGPVGTLELDNLTGSLTISNNLTVEGNMYTTGVNYGIYHAIVEDAYYFDDYNGSRNIQAFLKTQRSDIIKYRDIISIEYWDGSAWQDAYDQLSNVQKLLDGRQDTAWNVPSQYYKFRFTVTASTSWPTRAIIGAQTSWSGSSFPGYTLLVEEQQADNSWLTRVTADFTSANGVTNWGTAVRSDGALHTGRGSQTGSTRITVDFYGWTPNNASYLTIPLQNIFIYSNYTGLENNDYQNILDYYRNINAPANVNISSGSVANIGALQIYTSGSDSHIYTTNDMMVRSNNLTLQSTNSETYISAIPNGSVSLYYNNVKQLETTSSGVSISGTVSVNDSQTGISADDWNKTADLGYHDYYSHSYGGVGYQKWYTGHWSSKYIWSAGSSTGEHERIRFSVNGDSTDSSIEIHDSTSWNKVLTENSTLVNSGLSFNDDLRLSFGNSSDLQIYHDGSSGISYITETGPNDLRIIGGNDIWLLTPSLEELARFNQDGSVTLYHNGQYRLFTTATGIDVTGDITVDGTVDGYDISAMGIKLDSIETGATADQTASEILTLLKTVDGTSSGIDADLLDGQHGSYYLDAGNLSAGTLPNARLSTSNRYYAVDPAIPTRGNLDSHLGMPSIAQAAIQKGFIENKTQFAAPIVEYSTDNKVSWTTASYTTDQLKDLVKGRYDGSGITLDRSWTNVRFRWAHPGFANGYVFFNALYLYTSTNGNSVSNIKVEAKDYTAQTWSTYSDGNSFSSWPGHQWIPHNSIPFVNSNGRKDEVKITLDLNFSHASNSINIYNIDWFGSYPAARQSTAFSWDKDKNLLTTTALPMSTNTYDIGSASAAYRNAYLSGNISIGGLVDGRDIAADGAKLDGIEAGATADQTKADIDALNINADTLDGQHGSYYTSYADQAIANLVDSSPTTLDTLNELAAALGDDPNFATTVTNSIGAKVSKSGDGMTGNLSFSQPSQIVFANAQKIFDDGSGGLTVESPLYNTNIKAGSSGAVKLYQSGTPRLTTNATGIDVTGTITTDGIISDGNGGFAGLFRTTSDAAIELNGNGTSYTGIKFTDVASSDYLWFNGGQGTFAIGGGGANVVGKKLHIDGGVSIGSSSDATATPTDGLYVQGNIQHSGLMMTAGTDVDQLYTATMSYTAGTSWTDTGIKGTDLSTGTYIVQVFINDTNVYQYSETYSGNMSWYSGNTNDTYSDEIALYSTGHASNNRHIYLRTIRTLGTDPDDLKLQISADYTGVLTTVTFKFRRMI